MGGVDFTGIYMLSKFKSLLLYFYTNSSLMTVNLLILNYLATISTI